MLPGGGTWLWRKQSEPGPSFILRTCVQAIIQYAFLRGGGQDVLGRDVSGWIIKYFPYSYKYFSGPRKRGLSLFIPFPNESKTSNVIIHSYTEKICIKMDPMIRFSSPCVRNNTQYTAQQNYAVLYTPGRIARTFAFKMCLHCFHARAILRFDDAPIRQFTNINALCLVYVKLNKHAYAWTVT